MLNDNTYSLGESTINIGGREYRVRFSLNALLCLERQYRPLSEILRADADKWDWETVIQLAYAAMADMPWNRKAVSRRSFDRLRPSAEDINRELEPQDLNRLRYELAAAVNNSLPPINEGSSDDGTATDEGHYYVLARYIVGMSEAEYWQSNYRRIDYITTRYLEAKGYKSPAIKVQQYDD